MPKLETIEEPIEERRQELAQPKLEEAAPISNVSIPAVPDQPLDPEEPSAV